MTRSSIDLFVLRVGACRHLECLADRGGRWSLVDFPALCGLIHHPTRGWILYDTGYSEHFFEHTQQWPERLYRAALPVALPDSERLATQLARHGLTVDDIATVIVSHYHGDHVAGLRNFPNARFLALRSDTRHLRSMTGRRFRATLKGFLPGLLPDDYFTRLENADEFEEVTLPSWMKPFDRGFDLLGDSSLVGVPLPGHAAGQLGIFMPDVAGRPVFLVADACWSRPALLGERLPSPPALFLNADRRRYRDTFAKLAHLARRENALQVLPSHCPVAWNDFHSGG